MSLVFPSQNVTFYYTSAMPCPYLPDQEEIKLFTYLDKSGGRELNDELTQIGFRRVQSIAYRPACLSCDACKSSRVLVQKFTPSRSMKRILRANADLTRTIKPPIADDEHYKLICQYLSTRHKSGGMDGMDKLEFTELIEDTCLKTELVDYRNETGELLASVLIDQLADGPSMFYSFFDINMPKRSLGNFMILDHINRAKLDKKRHLYLGYWVKNSQKMSYKQRFAPIEIAQGKEWELLGKTTNEQI